MMNQTHTNKLEALQSRHFTIGGKHFECVGTLTMYDIQGTPIKDDCYDLIKAQATGKIHRVKRSETIKRKPKWVLG